MIRLITSHLSIFLFAFPYFNDTLFCVWADRSFSCKGYTLFLWETLLGWDKTQYQIFLMKLRKEIRMRSIHAYLPVRYIWGRKPDTAA